MRLTVNRNKESNRHKKTAVRKHKCAEVVTYLQHITLALDTYFREYLIFPGVSSSVSSTGGQEEVKEESCNEKKLNNVYRLCKVFIEYTSWCVFKYINHPAFLKPLW